MADLSTEILIAGGGPVGLTASLLLADLGIDSIVVERRDGRSRLPKAHILNCRTMEIFEQLGFADEVYQAGAPPENISQTAWYTSLGGDRPMDRRLVMTLDSWGGGELQDDYERDSACRAANLPQKLLEPRLRRVAESRTPGRILFQHELVGLHQDADGVTAVVKAQDGETLVHAQYLLGADGGHTVGRQVGIELEGPPPFIKWYAMHFAADLSPWIHEDASLLRFINRVGDDGFVLESALLGVGPEHWDRHSEEWVLTVVAPMDHPLASTEWADETASAIVRDILRIDDLDLEMRSIGGWAVESLLANRYRAGRVFVAGDAAHRHPPTAGLGLNAGIADVHNLCWKLAARLRGRADDALLESYEEERRPVAARNVEFTMFCAFTHMLAQSGWGVIPNAPPQHNLASFETMFDDTLDGAARRARLRHFLKAQRPEYQAHDVEIGYEYSTSPVITDDGSPAPPRDPLGVVHVRSSRPGHRAPHVWFTRDDRRVATHQLLRPGTFLLLLGDEDGGWRAAGAALAGELGLEIETLAVGGPHGEVATTDRDWPAVRGHDGRGALLIRPDGHVAMRAVTSPEDHVAALRDALVRAVGQLGVTATSAERVDT